MAIGTTNISLSAVAAYIGESSLSLFTIGTSDKINKWARYKPVRDAGEGVNWPRGQAGQFFGFDLTSATPWTYLQPRGGSPGGTPDEPVRLGDFRGYNHDALPPFSVTGPGASQLNNDVLQFLLEINENDITVEDLDVEDWFFCVKINNTYYYADYELGYRSSQPSAKVILVPVAAGSYSWEAFIGGQGSFVPIPGTYSGSTGVTLEEPVVHTDNQVVGLNIMFYISDGYVKFSKTGTFSGGVDFIVNEVYAQSYFFDGYDELAVITSILPPTGWGSEKTIVVVNS